MVALLSSRNVLVNLDRDLPPIVTGLGRSWIVAGVLFFLGMKASIAGASLGFSDAHGISQLPMWGGPPTATNRIDDDWIAHERPYTAFNPTPRELMREFMTDRPDVTESPFTVDAGHFQIEADIVNYTRQRSEEGTGTVEKFLFGATMMRLGVLDNLEADLLVQPYNVALSKDTQTGRTTRNAGLDVLQARMKWNVYGNDTFNRPGATAFGLIPFANIPAVNNGVSNNSFEGGLILPFAIRLSEAFDLGVMTEVDVNKNGRGSGYHLESLNSASLGFEIAEGLSSYVELTGRFGAETRLGPLGTINTGILFKIDRNTQFDFGINVGLTRAADGYNPFIGFSKRF